MPRALADPEGVDRKEKARWKYRLDEREVSDELFLRSFTIRSQDNDADGQVKVVPFRLRPVQKKLHDAETLIEKTQYLEMHVPKARKHGISTHTLARYGFARILRRPGYVTTMTAHKVSATGVHRRFLKHLCRQVNWNALAALKYFVEEDTAQSFAVKHPNGLVSRVEFLTARTEGLGRGETPNCLISTERPHYPKAAKEEFFSVLGSIPKVRGNCWIDESTANGEGDEFHEDCKRALAGKGLAKLLFMPAYEHPANYLPFGSAAQRAEFEKTIGDPDYGEIGEENSVLAAVIGHWMNQENQYDFERARTKAWEFLRWRRVEIDTGCRGSVEHFHQENPTNLDEAFLGTGRPVFIPRVLRSWNDRADAKTASGVKGRLVDRDGEVVFERGPGAGLTVYRPPEDGTTYCWGMDVSSGIEHLAHTGKVADWTVVVVKDAYSGMTVAKFRDHVVTPEAARTLALLVRYYRLRGEDVLARGLIELGGGHGDAVVASFLELEDGAWTDALLTTTAAAGPRTKVQPETVYGFKASRNGKALLKGRGEEFIGEEIKSYDPVKNPDAESPWDRETLDEMKSFAYTKHGGMEASSGFDDCVIAELLALQARAKLFADGQIRLSSKRTAKPEIDPIDAFYAAQAMKARGGPARGVMGRGY